MPEPLGEDKKKGKPEKLKRCIRTAAGSSWEDPSLLEWDAGEWPEQEAGYYPSKNRLHSVFRATNMEKEAGGLRSAGGQDSPHHVGKWWA